MRFAAPLLVAVLGLALQGARADELRLAVAGNFVPVMERIGPEFEARSGHSLAISPGSTGKLYAQIVQGAPFAVFLAADGERPRRLEAQGLALPGTRASYALGRLALWAPSAGDASQAIALLHRSPAPRLALANPRLAPYGAAAEAWLRREGLWTTLGAAAARGENVSQAYHFVATGNADLGLVALSQLRLADPAPAGAYWVVPADGHPPIEQQLVLLEDSPGARSFRNWILSAAVQARLGEFGYGEAP